VSGLPLPVSAVVPVSVTPLSCVVDESVVPESLPDAESSLLDELEHAAIVPMDAEITARPINENVLFMTTP
jgi:hypothetical protein